MLGASQGAALALATAPTLNPRPAGVVSLSAESTAGTVDALAGVAAYPGPVLLVGTENDMYAPAAPHAEPDRGLHRPRAVDVRAAVPRQWRKG